MKHLIRRGYGCDNALWVNVDETSLSRASLPAEGSVVRFRKGSRHSFTDHQSLQHRRTNSTLLASVCNDAEMQPILPHILIGKWTKRDHRSIASMFKDSCPSVLVLRNQKGWMTGNMFEEYIHFLRACVDAVTPGRRVVLLFDVAQSHLTEGVLAAAASCKIRIMLVPAKMTPFLQPLDVSVFAAFKRELKNNSRQSRAAGEDTSFSMEMWGEAVLQTIQSVLQEKTWVRAFVKVGLTNEVASFGTYLSAFSSEHAEAPDQPLTHEELALYSGKRYVSHSLHMGLFRQLSLTILRRAIAEHSSSHAAPSGEESIPAI
jgi:hypothetical protein